MVSFSKISPLVLMGCLIGGFFYYYTTHYKLKKQLESLKTYEFSDQKLLLHSKHGFPFFAFDKSLGDKEHKSLSFILKKLIPLKSTVLHLGAHTGVHTILIAREKENKGKILAFEGHPKFFLLLKENIALHNLGSILQTFPFIPSSARKTLSVCLDASPPTSGDTMIDSSYEQKLKGKNCYDIQLKPLDSLSLDPVDFIFIENDINIPEAIEGGYQLLTNSNWPPIFIIPSINLSHTHHKRWIGRLKKEGYYFYKLVPKDDTSFKIMQTDPYHVSSEEGYLFFSRELLPMMID